MVDNVKLTLLPSLGDGPKHSKWEGQSLLEKQDFIMEILASLKDYFCAVGQGEQNCGSSARFC